MLLALFGTMLRFLTVLLLSSVSSALMAAEIPFYVGTYTKPEGSKGIYRFTLDLDFWNDTADLRCETCDSSTVISDSDSLAELDRRADEHTEVCR